MKNIYNITPEHLPIVQLSGSKTLFKKQLIRFGEWIDPIYPDAIMKIDRQFMESVVNNFHSKVIGRVPVPLTHTDNPEYNTGELVELTIEGDGSNTSDGLYGLLEIRRDDTAEDIRDGLIWDVSISFTTNYQDNETGQDYGPTLIHVALVNNPYIKKMSPFTALSEALKSLFPGVPVRALSEQTNKETTMHKVKNDRSFAIEVKYSEGETEIVTTLEPGQELELADETTATAVTTQLSEAVEQTAEGDAEGEGEGEGEGDAEGDNAEGEANEGDNADDAGDQGDDSTDLSDNPDKKRAAELERELSETKAKLLAQEVEAQYDASLKAGKIVPAQKDAFVALSMAVQEKTYALSDGTTANLSDLLAEFIEKAPKVVSFSEDGKDTDDSDVPPEVKAASEGLQATGTTAEDFVKYGAGKAVSAADLLTLGKD